MNGERRYRIELKNPVTGLRPRDYFRSHQSSTSVGFEMDREQLERLRDLVEDLLDYGCETVTK